MIKLKIHHFGLVVNNIKDSLGELSNFLTFEKKTISNYIDSQRVNVCFINFGEIKIELIEPAEKKSPVSNFLEKGGGFHHICFEVTNISKSIDEFIQKGARLIVSPTIGFDNNKIAFLFLNMKKTNCNLIELVELKND